jgi:hypothetical protein
MAEERKLAAEYRRHATALRAAAKFDEHAKTSIALKSIARDYEQMALALEGIHEVNESVGKASLAAAREKRARGPER